MYEVTCSSSCNFLFSHFFKIISANFTTSEVLVHVPMCHKFYSNISTKFFKPSCSELGPFKFNYIDYIFCVHYFIKFITAFT